MAATGEPATGGILSDSAHSGGMGSVGLPAGSAGPTYNRGVDGGQKYQPASPKSSGMFSTQAGAQQKSAAFSLAQPASAMGPASPARMRVLGEPELHVYRIAPGCPAHSGHALTMVQLVPGWSVDGVAVHDSGVGASLPASVTCELSGVVGAS